MSVRTEERSQAPTELGSGVVGGIVIGGDYQGLGIARSLGRRGIPVIVLDDEISIASTSRYVQASIRTDDLRTEDGTVAALQALARSHDVAGWVLYPTRDETVAAIARRRDELAALFRVPTPAWDTIELADDKRKTYELARQLGIPIPASAVPGSFDAFDPVAQPGPWAIKPAIKERFIYATKRKAWRADDERQLRDAFERAAAIVGPDEVIIQELIPGDGRHQVAFCALCDDGRVVAEMTVRRLRQHPPEFGRASTFAETVDLPDVAASARRFLEAMRCDGLVEVEFKLDPRDGRYKLLDVNARTWGYHTLGAQAGVDFPYLLYRSATGHAVPSVRARPDVGWVRLLTDVPTALGEIWAGRLSPRAYLRSLSRVRADAVFSLRDPLPGLAELALVPYLLVKRGR